MRSPRILTFLLMAMTGLTGASSANATVDVQPIGVTLGTNPITAGGAFFVSWEMKNNGTSTAPVSNTQVRITTSSTSPGTSANNVGSLQPTATIPAGSVVDQSERISAPSVAGTYYVWIVADSTGVLTQTDTSNDATPSVALTVTGGGTVDVQPISISLGSGSVTVGGSVTVNWQIKNNGTATAATSNTQLRITTSSSDSGTSANNTGSTLPTGTISAGATVNQSASVTVPSTPGTYYIWVIADSGSVLVDSNVGNNAGASTALTVNALGTVDVQPANVLLSNGNATAGGSITVTWQVKNNGTATAATSNSQVRITSSNTNAGTASNNVGTSQATGTIVAGGTVNQSATVTVPSTAGTYYVWVIADSTAVLVETDTTNDTAVSSSLVVTAGSPVVAPVISQGPTSQSVQTGASVTFTVTASGSGTLGYQWQKDGTALSGQTSSSLSLSNVQTSDAGQYSVVVSNAGGSTTSSAATLTVTAPPPPNNSPVSRVINLSTRAQVGTDSNVLIAGFIINGTTPKQMLIRAVGPTLTNFNVDGVLANPAIRIVAADGTTLASNDDWGSSANLSDIIAAHTATGAFALPTNSKDSVVLVTLNPGAYTAVVSGVNNTSGVALAEFYEVDTTTSNELINISSRAFVGTGSNVMISGLIVKGSVPQRFLIRAVGPGLNQFGVPNVLADPQFNVVDASGTTIASNNDWENSPTVSDTKATSAAINVFALASGSKDSALVVSLNPGAYTVVVSGVNSTTGVALVEAYLAP